MGLIRSGSDWNYLTLPDNDFQYKLPDWWFEGGWAPATEYKVVASRTIGKPGDMGTYHLIHLNSNNVFVVLYTSGAPAMWFNEYMTKEELPFDGDWDKLTRWIRKSVYHDSEVVVVAIPDRGDVALGQMTATQFIDKTNHEIQPNKTRWTQITFKHFPSVWTEFESAIDLWRKHNKEILYWVDEPKSEILRDLEKYTGPYRDEIREMIQGLPD